MLCWGAGESPVVVNYSFALLHLILTLGAHMVIALILCAENDLLKATFLGSCVSRTQSQGSDFGQ